MPYSIILWDFDGTLADTLPGLLRIFNDLAPEFGLAPIEDVQAMRDTPPLDLLRQRGIRWWKMIRLRNAIVRRQKDQLDSIRLFPGVPEMLERLHACGYRLGVVSSNSEANIRRCLQASDVEQWFELVVGSWQPLGKHRSLRRVLWRTGVQSDQALYVGDEVRDITAARRSGMDAAAVTWGGNSRQLLAQYSPTKLFNCPSQITSWLTDSSQ
jgi:HAD superfamily hydrolase (TIGR01549 family)